MPSASDGNKHQQNYCRDDDRLTGDPLPRRRALVAGYGNKQRDDADRIDNDKERDEVVEELFRHASVLADFAPGQLVLVVEEMTELRAWNGGKAAGSVVVGFALELDRAHEVAAGAACEPTLDQRQ